MTSAAQRGYDFELVVSKLLRDSGFAVTRNARAARPRQTDIYATLDDLHLIVEVKNRRKKIDVSDIDAMRSRLARTPADVVGAIFTTSSLTANAIEVIETHRGREIIVFQGEEIGLLSSGKQNLWALIQRKRKTLRKQGKVWTAREGEREFLSVKLPHGETKFRCAEVNSSYFSTRTRNAHTSFALQVPDTGWGSLCGEGASLTLDIALNSSADLHDLFGLLHDWFGLTAAGAFSIHQTDAAWHGVGARDFVEAVGNWRRRYSQAGLKKLHHSEDLHYLDQLRDGWLSFSSRQRVDLEGDRSFFHHSELTIQLPGLPVDMAPYLNLCRYTRNDWGQFRYISQRLTFRRRLSKAIPLDVVGAVITVMPNNDRIAVGVIARNPFFRRRRLPRELQDEELVALQDILETELLLCSLRDCHPECDVVDRYVLQGFEGTATYSSHVIRPYGTWNKIVQYGPKKRNRLGELQKLGEEASRLSAK